MEALKPLEESLAGVFKNAPKISESGRKTLVNVWPWLALIFGVLQLAAAYWLWQLTRVATELYDYLDSFSRAYAGRSIGPSGFDKTLIYIGIAIVLVDAVILLMAFPKLQKKEKAGWDLLFLGSLLNVVYSVLTIFIDGRGFGSFLVNLIGSTIGFWLLFQVRDLYKGKATAKPTTTK